jgi:hypothetical protein
MILQELQMPLMVYLYIYNKKDDDTSKEIQEMPVEQQVAKTAQDIFMGIRFVGSGSQRTYDGL